MSKALVEKALANPDAALAEIDRELVSRGGLAEFVRLAWPNLEPGHPLLWGWHLDALCEHVQAVLDGKLTRLLIAVPPGTMKSLVSAVFAPAYQWGPAARPERRMLFTSYSQTFATRDSVRCRRLIESPWYQARWPDVRLTTDQNTKTRYENSRTGLRACGSVGSGVTGERVGLVVCDDLLNREHAESAAHRAEASGFFWETLPSRVNDLDRDAFLVIAQRLHQQDTIGEILSREPERWEKLVLPLEFEPSTRCSTSLGFADPRTAAGEVLHPARFSPAAVAGLKKSLGAYAYAGQYGQTPVPREGGLVKAAWLSTRYERRGEKPRLVVQSWDCASKPAERNDPSACVTAAVFSDRVELWHALAERLEFPDLLRKAKDHAAYWRPQFVLIEDKDAGQQLAQTLKRDKTFRHKVEAIDPEGLDKYTRMAAEAPALERHEVWLPDPGALPEAADWLAPFLEQLLLFPAGAHDDQVDALSQLLKWLRRRAAGSRGSGWNLSGGPGQPGEGTGRESPNKV